ncbi:hypothetical protein AaE_005167, partial [Aphanomyces astaci]
MADATSDDGGTEALAAGNGRPSGPEKVTIQFTAVGGAPIMKRSKFTVNGIDPLSHVYIFLRKQLRLKDDDALFVYCNNSFAPTPDQRMYELFE